MKRGLLLTALGIITIALVGALVYTFTLSPPVKAPQPPQSSTASPTATTKLAQVDTEQPSTTPITVIGKIDCISPPASNSGAQSTSCAIGMVGDDGKQYLLYNQDPLMVGSIPTGQRVQVTGGLRQLDRSTTTPVINVDKVVRL